MKRNMLKWAMGGGGVRCAEWRNAAASPQWRKSSAFLVPKVLSVLLFVAVMCGVVQNNLWATVTRTVNGDTGLNFTLNFRETGDTLDDTTADASLSPDQRDAVIRVFQYYADTFGSLSGGAPTTIEIGMAAQNHFPQKNGEDITLAHAAGNHICLSPLLTGNPERFGLAIPTQLGGSNSQFFPVIMHEYTHLLGMLASVGGITTTEGIWEPVKFMDTGISTYASLLRDSNRVQPVPNMTVGDASDTFNAVNDGVVFVGTNARRVYGDDVPVFSPNPYNNGSSLSHLNTPHGMLNSGTTTDMRPFFSEVELALLVDLGATINLENHFGRSFYQTLTGTQTNNDGFNSTSDYGVGLHLVAGGNTVVQDADLFANGYAGAGIRIENDNNTVTIANGRTIQANGEEGIGVLSIWEENASLADNGTTLINNGTIEATGTNGEGVHFARDVKSFVNTGTISAASDAVASYADVTNFNNSGTITGGVSIYANVEVFNNTGTLNANASFGSSYPAITIRNGSIDEINIMAGSNIIGRIDADSSFDDANNNGIMDEDEEDSLEEGYATLTFGKLADANSAATENGDSNFDFTYDGHVRGGNITGSEGSINLETWGGKTTLNGVNTFSLGTVGQGDTLSELTVNNISSFSLLLWVSGNGTLSGSGTVQVLNSYLLNTGTIAPGNSIGTLTIAGSLENHNTGTFEIEIDPSHANNNPVPGTHNDLVNVVENPGEADGEAFIWEGNVNVITAPGHYTGNTKYTFLTTENGLTVDTPLTVTDTIPLFALVGGYDAYDYWLEVQREYLYGQFGATLNQQAVGNYLDDIGLDPNPTGDFFNVLVELDKLNAGIPHRGGISAAAMFAEDQMSGAIYGTLAQNSVMNTTIVNNTLNDVLRRGTYIGSANADPCDPCAPCDPCDPCSSSKPNKRNVWGLGYGIGGNVQFDGNSSGYEQSFGGTLIGMDRLYRRSTRVGAYLSYGEGHVSSGLLDKSESQELLIGLYLHKKMALGYFLLSGGLGQNQYDTERTISFVNRQAKSEHEAIVGTVYAERGLEYKGKYAAWQPFFGLQYAGNQQDRFTETGANSLSLLGDTTTGHSFRSLLGLRSSLNGRNGFSLFGQAVWMHEFLNQTSTDFTAQFSNPGMSNFSSTSKYTVRGNDPGQDWVVLGAGLKRDVRNWQIFAGYDAYVNDRQVLHTGNAGLSVGW